MRWPRSVPETSGFVLGREIEQWFKRTGHRIHACVWVSDVCKACWDRKQREVSWITIRDLFPAKRRRYTGVGKRSHRIRGAGGPVLRVLVVVEENAMALFFPPLGTGQCGCAPLHCTRHRYCRTAYFRERPVRLDTHVHVHAARTA